MKMAKTIRVFIQRNIKQENKQTGIKNSKKQQQLSRLKIKQHEWKQTKLFQLKNETSSKVNNKQSFLLKMKRKK